MIEKHKTKKLKVTRKAIFVFGGIFVALAVLVTGIIIFASRSRGFEETLVTLPFDKDSSYVAVDNSVVYIENDLLRCVNSSLTTLWKKRLLSSNLDLISNNDKVAAIGDGLLQIVDVDGNHLSSTKIDGEIMSARICDNKVAVCVEQLTGDEKRSYIISFDLAGTFLYQIEVTDLYVLDYGFDYSNDLLFLLELDTSGVVPISRISTFRPETQSLTSVKELYGQLVDQIYIINGTVYSLGTNQITIYTSLGDHDNEIMVYGWMQQDFYLQNEPSFVYIHSNTDENGIDTIRIIRPSGNETSINLPPDVFRVLYLEDKVYCFSQTSIFVYSNEGRFLRTLDMPFSITDVNKAYGNYVFITIGDSMYLMPLS